MPDINREAFAPTDQFALTSVNNNSVCTATLAAATGWTWYVTGYSLSLSAAAGAAVSATVKNGTGGTVIEQLEIPAATIAPIVVNLNRPLKLTTDLAAEISCPAVGGVTRCTVSIRGFKVKSP